MKILDILAVIGLITIIERTVRITKKALKNKKE